MSNRGLLREYPDALAENEEIIERGLASFVEVGNALMRIRDEGLYHQAGFDGFVEYLESKQWGLSPSRAYQEIDAARISNIVGNGLNSRQANELAPLLRKATPDVVRRVYAEVVAETEGKPTAAFIREKVRDLVPRKKRSRPVRALTVDLRPEGLLETVTAAEELVRALVLIRSGNTRPDQLQSAIQKLEWVSEEIEETLRVLKERSAQ